MQGSQVKFLFMNKLNRIPCSRVHERFMNKVQISLAVFFFFLNMFMNKRRWGVHEQFMNMFKFQDGIWTKLEQVEFEQVHEHVHEQIEFEQVQNLFMNSSNSICSSSCDGHMENKKKSRKIRKNGIFFEGEIDEERYGRGGIKCRDTGPSTGTDCCCKWVSWWSREGDRRKSRLWGGK